MSEKFRNTRKLLNEDTDGYEKALLLLSGTPVVTAVMDVPETAASLAEDAASAVEKVADRVFDFFDL